MRQNKSKHLIHYLLNIGFFLTIITLIGCTVERSNNLENENVNLNTAVTPTTVVSAFLLSATSSPSKTPKVIPTATPLPSITATSTSTNTLVPTNTPTVSATQMKPTLTPLPIISPEQRGYVYEELMRTNGGCALPCWWGFENGVDSVQEVRQFYEAFGAHIFEQKEGNGVSILDALFIDPQIENGEQVHHIFIAQDEIIIESLIDADNTNYQIVPLLKQLGKPSNIWLWTIPEPFQGILPTRFRLYFPDHGVFVLFATDGVKVDETVHVCFDTPGGVTLLLWEPNIWDPDGTKGIVDRSNEGGSQFILEGFPIEEVSNWDVEKFYETLTDPTQSECLVTSSEHWTAP